MKIQLNTDTTTNFPPTSTLRQQIRSAGARKSLLRITKVCAAAIGVRKP